MLVQNVFAVFFSIGSLCTSTEKNIDIACRPRVRLVQCCLVLLLLRICLFFVCVQWLQWFSSLFGPSWKRLLKITRKP